MENVINELALHEVFSICDDDNDGYITVERFFQVAKENFSQWENNKDTMIKIASLLNQNHNGLINFENFCSGIMRILDLYVDRREDDVDSGAWSSKSQETPKADCLASLDEFFDSDITSQQNLNSTPYAERSNLQYFNFSAPNGHRGSFRKKTSTYNLRKDDSRRSSLSDGAVENMNSYYDLLGDKVNRLEEQLQAMHGSQLVEEQIRNKLKDENSTYIHKINLLEEQLREVELTSEERFLEERKKREEYIAKNDKDKTNQIEVLTESLRLIEQEYKELLKEVPLIKSENEKLKQTNSQLILEQQQIESSLALSESERENLQNFVQAEINKINQERSINSQLVDELSEELKDLRKFKLDSRHGSPHDTKLPRSAHKEIELHVDNIRKENMELRAKVDDLQGQLLYKQYNQGRQLLGDKQLNSLASEMTAMSKDELLQIIESERDRNRMLLEYIESILQRILDTDPNLLEISSKNKSTFTP